MTAFWAIRGCMDSVTAADAAEAKGDVRATRRNLGELDARLDRTLLACEAMWTLLREKLGVSDLALIERINELDLSDGRLDGKVRKTPVSCPSCGRTLSRKFPKCMYCGQQVMHDPFA